MGEALEDATARVSVLLATMVGALVAVLLPSLLTTASHAAGSVTVAVLALAFAALARSGLGRVAPGARARPATPSTGNRVPPVLPDRATDPVHHPLRPRAPGLA